MPQTSTAKRPSKQAGEPCANTRYIDRLIEALALLCGGKKPSREDVVGWEENTSEELQSWAVDNAAVRWATGIGTIEAAQTLANTAEEGRGHEYREDVYPTPATGFVPTSPADELNDKLGQAFAGEWQLSMSDGGNGSVVTADETIYFQSAQELDNLLNEQLAQPAQPV